jgi:hypothetical protein
MDDHLGVALRGEPMPAAKKCIPQFFVIVDLPVENEKQISRLIGHRVVNTIRQVHDRQTCLS